MVRFVFTVEDLARTRFAISPLWELTRSLLALRDPSTAALHVPWLRSLSGSLGGIALEGSVALVVPRGYTPDFVTPPPAGPLGAIDAELEALRRTPVEQVRHDMELFASEHPRLRVTGPLLADPAAELARLADTFQAYWERALAPEWPRIRAFLESDIAHRAGRLAEGGPAALFSDLHPGIAWGGDHLYAGSSPDAEVALAGRGFLLMPSAFTWAAPATIDIPPCHLLALRDAGLATSRREGRAILYVRTPAADALL